MTDQSNLVSRRNALKGLVGFAGTSAVGAGTIITASEPVAAVDHHIEVDDIEIALIAEEGESVGLSEIGISDIWFELQWEHIENTIYVVISLHDDDLTTEAELADVDLGIDGDGTETFGYGETYEDSYDVDLDGPSYLDGGTPLHTSPSTEFLNRYQLEGSEDEKLVPTELHLSVWLADDDGSRDASFGGQMARAITSFDVALNRIEPGAEVDGGEADVYGE